MGGTVMRKVKELPATQLLRFLAHIDAVTEQLRPARRPQDRGAPECSPRELRALTAIGERQGINMTGIASAIGVTLGTATHTVGKLAAKGLVERIRDPRDRRVVHVRFSHKGRNIHKYVLETRRALGQDLLERLDPASRARFLAALEILAGKA
jgi:DNA-binding MarR family transcriptional regulator